MSINIMDSGIKRGDGFNTRAADMRDSHILRMSQDVIPGQKRKAEVANTPVKKQKSKEEDRISNAASEHLTRVGLAHRYIMEMKKKIRKMIKNKLTAKTANSDKDSVYKITADVIEKMYSEDLSTHKRVTQTGKSILVGGVNEDGTNDALATLLNNSMKALYERNGSKELILKYAKLLGSLDMVATGSVLINFIEGMGKRYGFEVVCRPSRNAVAKTQSNSVLMNTEGDNVVLKLKGS